MKIKRVSPLSLAKITGLLLTAVGFLFGAMITILTIISAATGAKIEGVSGYIAIIFLPVGYGAFGFIMGFVQAWLFNMVAKKIGGLEIEVE